MKIIEPCCFNTQLTDTINAMRDGGQPFDVVMTNGDVPTVSLLNFLRGQLTTGHRVVVAVPALSLTLARAVKEVLNAQVRDRAGEDAHFCTSSVTLLCGRGHSDDFPSVMEILSCLDMLSYGKRLRVALTECRQTTVLEIHKEGSTLLFGNTAETPSREQNHTLLFLSTGTSLNARVEKSLLRMAIGRYVN